jgi:hypothetical protein
MSYYSQWQAILQDSQSNASQEKVREYYELETAAYDWILQNAGEPLSGSAGELADKLGFSHEMVIFLGFLDGINASLKAEIGLDQVEDSTPLTLEVDFRRLYWHMHEAKADWLYGLPSWNNLLSADEQRALTREYRESKIVHVEKVGRNDPCPCGSGKKYKNCCGRG